MVHACWHIGREIVEVEQRGEARTGRGERLMKRLAAHLSSKFGKGFSLASLKRMRQFYRALPQGSALATLCDGKAQRC
jgi:predicted GNAT family N-acyltransferase